MVRASANVSDFVQVLRERGYVHQVSDEEALRALAVKAPLTAYIGFDCTAPSLHVGNLIGIMLLRVLQRCGHKPIALVGGGTTKVGDPSGKDESRKLLTEAEIEANKARIRETFSKFLHFGEGKTDAILVDNDEWLRELELYRVPERLRPAFHHQPHADLRLGEAPAGARAAADVPRIQLHAAAGLRFPRIGAAL